MARRATRALAAVLTGAVLALPLVMLARNQPAEAATSQDAPTSQDPVRISITGMTPRWATPGGTITVSGTLSNNSRAPITQPAVQLFGAGTPVGSVTDLQADASQLPNQAIAPLSGATWHASGPLAPGATAGWSIRVRSSTIGMTTFGVYPLVAQAQHEFGNPDATTTTYLPYEPGRKGPGSSSRPRPAKIAWLWPLIDVPLLNEPWQYDCTGPQASALAQSLGQRGRLGELVDAGGTDQAITWVIDPAVLANVQALAGCQSAQPRWAKAASAWLTSLQSETKGRPLTVTPYGDPNAAALIAVGHPGDVNRSFQLGRALASKILGGRDLNPVSATGPAGANADPLAQAAGIAWSADGVPGYATLEDLGPADGVRTLVLSSGAFADGQYSVLRTLDGGGCGSQLNLCYLTVLLASQPLTQLLESSASTPGSAFTVRQRFLAETALLAQQAPAQKVPAQPIVVAPPPRWAPSSALASGLVAETMSAPWLSQVSLTSLAGATHIPIVPNENWPAGTAGPNRVTRSELRKLRVLEREIGLLQGFLARPDPELFLAVSALESSAYQGASSGTTDAMLATVTRRIDFEQQAVRIIAEKRITLGGLKGSVPVSIDNRLDSPVKVQLQLQYNQASGIKITPDPQGLVTVPPHQTQTIRLRVQATEVGSTTVTMVLTAKGSTFSVPLRMTIQATQVGVLGVIIFAAALGVFLIASAARAVRRGRPGTGVDQLAGGAQNDDHESVRSADPAGADTVNAERTELGAVGKPGP